MKPETQWAARGHDFYPTDTELAEIPALYATELTPRCDKVIHLHYFAGASDWWVTELDPESGRAYGYVCLSGDTQNAEWGYLDLRTLEELYVPAGMFSDEANNIIGFRPRVLIERDLDWQPATVAEAGLPGPGGEC